MRETWTVRLDGRMRPIIEAIARDEEREPAQVVRRLLNRALAQQSTSSTVEAPGGARTGQA